jgi:hypothetical protein
MVIVPLKHKTLNGGTAIVPASTERRQGGTVIVPLKYKTLNGGMAIVPGSALSKKS